MDDAGVCLDIVQLAKQEFPQLKILARARNRQHAYELHKIGVDYFRRETFDSALTMAQEAMKYLGRDENDMRQKAAAFMKHDEATLEKSFEFFEDRARACRLLPSSSGRVGADPAKRLDGRRR